MARVAFRVWLRDSLDLARTLWTTRCSVGGLLEETGEEEQPPSRSTTSSTDRGEETELVWLAWLSVTRWTWAWSPSQGWQEEEEESRAVRPEDG